MTRLGRGVRSARLLALAGLCWLGVAAPALAEPTVWDLVQDPRRGKAEQLLALAERSRMPGDDSLEAIPEIVARLGRLVDAELRR